MGTEDKTTAWEHATAGTYADRRMPRGALAAVLVLALVIVAVPSVGMLWARTDSTTENRALAEAPALFGEDGSPNVGALADMGAYFDDHFAYRNVLVAANARIRAALGTSATDQVVMGADGWLYYGGTLPDYLGQNELSERALRNIAHNLALAQSYVESRGATFAFAIAPNKNSLYPEHMPYYYVRSPGAGNAERLAPLLAQEGVNYADLFELFEDMPGERYLKRDSHWDNRGALSAAQKLLAALGRDPLDLDVADAVARDDFDGDLESMLYPVGAQPEANWYFEGYDDGAGMSGARWTYGEGESVTDSWIRTRSVAEDGSLLMFRDSFGNALAPFAAAAFKEAAFSKLVPYNLPALDGVQADSVVLERAERHLGYLAANPPIMPAPHADSEFELPADGSVPEGGATLSVGEDGPYWKLEGVLGENVTADDVRIYVAVEPGGSASAEPAASVESATGAESAAGNGGAEADEPAGFAASGGPAVYDASWTTVTRDDGTQSDFGYQLYLSRDVVDLSGATVRVYAVEGGAPVWLNTFEDVA